VIVSVDLVNNYWHLSQQLLASSFNVLMASILSTTLSQLIDSPPYGTISLSMHGLPAGAGTHHQMLGLPDML
jgi:hypothetical protein